MKAVQMVTLGGEEYVILPKADYLRLSETRSVEAYGAVGAGPASAKKKPGRARRRKVA